METIYNIFIKWDIPYFLVIKRYLLLLSLLSLLIFFYPNEFKLFWENWWRLLVVIIFSRPLRDIFPRIRLLNKIVLLRKELWIICGFFILAHFIWYLITFHIWLISIFFVNIWKLDSSIMWWILWIIILLPILITSNNYSIIILWKYWKKVQRLTYLFFIFWALHIALINPEKKYIMLFLSILLSLVWFLAYKKIILWKKDI